MARIWYSVAGEGYGHSIRSAIIIDMLKKNGHDILITGSHKSYEYLNKKYKDTKKITGLTLSYKNNRVFRTKTIARGIIQFPYHLINSLFNVYPMVKRFKPDIIISDFDSVAHYLSKILMTDCITIDNIHVLTECDLKIPFHEKLLIKFLHLNSKYYLMNSFLNLKSKNPKAKIVPPLIREEIQKLKPTRKDHILVYQTSPTNVKIIPELEKTGEKYVIYGMKPQNIKNIIFKSFDEKRFSKDLAESKYVILNGGFTLISEALFLKKPILTIPIIEQFEQEFNANMIEKSGYGKRIDNIKSKDIIKFEKNLNKYETNIEKIKKWDNKIVIDEIEKILKSN